MSRPARIAGKVAMIGDAAIAVHCLRRLVDSGFEVVGCLPAGDAFAEECRSMGLRTFEVDAGLEVLLREPCDWILSVFNIRILPPELIRHPRRGVVNFHDGPLPRYAGLYAPTRALIDGESDHGVAWHLVDEGIDTGNLLVTESVPIQEDDNALALQLRCLEAGCRSFERLMPILREGAPAGRVQDRSLRTCFGHGNWSRLGIETNWRSRVSELQRIVAAHDFGPYDNPVGRPRFRLDDRWHALYECDPCVDSECPNFHASPGTTYLGKDGGLHVRCGDACLVVRRSEPRVMVENGSPGRMVVRDDREIAGIATWDEARFRNELFWRHRIDRLGSDVTWPRVADVASMDLGRGFESLACGLIACHAIHGEKTIDFALGWSEDELRMDVGPDVDPAVTSLLHPFAPVTVPIDSRVDLGDMVGRLEQAIEGARRRGPFLRDILDRVGLGGRALVDPEEMPIRVIDEAGAADTSEAAWVFQRREDGSWSVAGPRWAMESFGDLFADRRRLLEAGSTMPIASMPRVVGGTAATLESWEGSQSIPVPASFRRKVVERLRKADPGKVFIESLSDGGASDREMAELVHAWAVRLQASGVGPGDLVPVALDRGTPFVAVMLAVLCLGAGFVPLDPLSPDERVHQVLEVLDARVGVAASERSTPGGSMGWISSAPRVGMGTAFFAGIGQPEPDDVAFVLFTSGSTGKPRGVQLTHRNFDQYLEVVAENIHPRAYDRSAWTSSVAFDSSVAEILYPVIHDGTIVVLDQRELASASSLTHVFLERQITGFGCATALWASWVKYISRTADQIPATLRHVDIGGSVADPGIVEAWIRMTDPSQILMNRYGPTETTVTVTVHQVDGESLSGESIPIGRPERGTEIRILDDEAGRVPPGVEGEIWIGGGQVALGYLGMDGDQGGFQSLPGAEGRWFRTGDRGHWSSEGEIHFGGRSDDQVKIGGYRVELEEVRQAIAAIEDRHDFEVLAIGDSTERSLGVVIEWTDVDADTDSWVAGMESGLESTLPRFAIPRRWRFVDSIPRTPSGKTDRGSAEKLFEEPALEDDPSIDPGSPDWIASQVGRVLGRPVEDFSRSFFELGGDSLGAMRLHAILEEACGHRLPLTVVHAARGIDDLAARVGRSNVETVAERIRHGHRRYGVVETPGAPEILLMPGLHGEATLRHAWGSLANSCSIGAIDLDLDRCRVVLAPDLGAARFQRFIDDLVDLVTEQGDRTPPILMGYSIGGWIAFEIAATCRERGIELPDPILIEPGVHVDGTLLDRCRIGADTIIDSILNRDPIRALRRRMARPRLGDPAVDPRDPRGRLPDEKDREFEHLLVGALGDHRPRPAEVAARLVLRRGRGRRFATWHRLARGGLRTHWVDLDEHEDFFRYGSESLLVDVVERHLGGMRIGSDEPNR